MSPLCVRLSIVGLDDLFMSETKKSFLIFIILMHCSCSSGPGWKIKDIDSQTTASIYFFDESGDECQVLDRSVVELLKKHLAAEPHIMDGLSTLGTQVSLQFAHRVFGVEGDAVFIPNQDEGEMYFWNVPGLSNELAKFMEVPTKKPPQ